MKKVCKKKQFNLFWDILPPFPKKNPITATVDDYTKLKFVETFRRQRRYSQNVLAKRAIGPGEEFRRPIASGPQRPLAASNLQKRQLRRRQHGHQRDGTVERLETVPGPEAAVTVHGARR